MAETRLQRFIVLLGSGTAPTGSELSYGTFELPAPGNFDNYQAAGFLSEVLGRRITASQLPADQFTSKMPEGSSARA